MILSSTVSVFQCERIRHALRHFQEVSSYVMREGLHELETVLPVAPYRHNVVDLETVIDKVTRLSSLLDNTSLDKRDVREAVDNPSEDFPRSLAPLIETIVKQADFGMANPIRTIEWNISWSIVLLSLVTLYRQRLDVSSISELSPLGLWWQFPSPWLMPMLTESRSLVLSSLTWQRHTNSPRLRDFRHPSLGLFHIWTQESLNVSSWAYWFRSEKIHIPLVQSLANNTFLGLQWWQLQRADKTRHNCVKDREFQTLAIQYIEALASHALHPLYGWSAVGNFVADHVIDADLQHLITCLTICGFFADCQPQFQSSEQQLPRVYTMSTTPTNRAQPIERVDALFHEQPPTKLQRETPGSSSLTTLQAIQEEVGMVQHMIYRTFMLFMQTVGLVAIETQSTKPEELIPVFLQECRNLMSLRTCCYLVTLYLRITTAFPDRAERVELLRRNPLFMAHFELVLTTVFMSSTWSDTIRQTCEHLAPRWPLVPKVRMRYHEAFYTPSGFIATLDILKGINSTTVAPSCILRRAFQRVGMYVHVFEQGRMLNGMLHCAEAMTRHDKQLIHAILEKPTSSLSLSSSISSSTSSSTFPPAIPPPSPLAADGSPRFEPPSTGANASNMDGSSGDKKTILMALSPYTSPAIHRAMVAVLNRELLFLSDIRNLMQFADATNLTDTVTSTRDQQKRFIRFLETHLPVARQSSTLWSWFQGILHGQNQRRAQRGTKQQDAINIQDYFSVDRIDKRPMMQALVVHFDDLSHAIISALVHAISSLD